MSVSKIFLTSLSLTMLSTAPAMAADAYINGGTLRVMPSPGLNNVSLTVTGPDGFSAMVKRGDTLSVNLMEKGVLPDGLYRWRISGATNVRVKPSRASVAFGRSEADMNRPRYEMKVESGVIRVVNGRPLTIDRNATEED